MKNHIFLILLSSLSVIPISLSARPVDILSHEEMHKKADLVIIGNVISTQDQTNYSFETSKKDSWIPVYTKFKVLSILKGKLDNNVITFLHYRYYNKKMETVIIDGPCFIRFDPNQSDEFLLYLMKEPEGNVYSPVSGQMDPDISLRKLISIFKK